MADEQPLKQFWIKCTHLFQDVERVLGAGIPIEEVWITNKTAPGLKDKMFIRTRHLFKAEENAKNAGLSPWDIWIVNKLAEGELELVGPLIPPMMCPPIPEPPCRPRRKKRRHRRGRRGGRVGDIGPKG